MSDHEILTLSSGEVFVYDDIDAVRGDIFAYEDFESTLVELEGWGGRVVEVRSMNGREKAMYIKAIVGDDAQADARKIDFAAINPALMIATCYNPAKRPNGEYVSGVSQHKLFRSGDESLINDKSAAVLEKIANVARLLSGMGDDGESSEIKLVKNLTPGQPKPGE